MVEEKGTTALAEAAPAEIELTTEEKSEAKRRWDDKIAYFQDKIFKVQVALLVINWEQGEFLDSIINQGRHYGNKTVENFAKEISPPKGISVELANAYHRCYKRYTREQIEAAAEKKLSWRSLYYLLSVEDVKIRTDLENKVVERAITSKQLEQAVKKINRKAKDRSRAKGEKTDERSGAGVASSCRATISLAKDLTLRMDEIKDAHKQWNKMPDSPRKTELGARFKEVFKALEMTCKRAAVVVALGEKE